METKSTEELAEELSILRKKIEDLERLWTKFEGAGMFIKITFWVVSPLVTAFLFFKDHWKP